MEIINNSKNKDYFTQRNNELKPNGACNVTSMINALNAASWPVEKLASEKYLQPEDALMHFILTDSRVQTLWQKMDPNGLYPANEWHPVLAFGTNLFLQANGLLKRGEAAVEFGEKWRLFDFVRKIDEGGAAVLSGIFRAEGKKTIGHVVACVGYVKDDDGDVCGLVLDDSWGDYHDEYATKKGNDIVMSIEDFKSKIRHLGALDYKMGHMVSMFKGAIA